MVGEVLVRTGASAELWGAVGSRRLSPTARTLPKTARRLPKTARRLPTPATVCHELPRTASFLRRVRWSAFLGNGEFIRGRVLMFMTGRGLWPIGVSNQIEVRSVSGDLLLENEGEGTRSPVTVCHINFGGGCARLAKRMTRGPFGPGLRRGPRSAPNKPCRRHAPTKRPAPNKLGGTGQWLFDDSLAARADHTATFGDDRRQDLRARRKAGGDVLPGWQRRGHQGDSSKRKPMR